MAGAGQGYAAQAQDQLAAAWRKLIEAGETSAAQTPASPLLPSHPRREAAAGEPLSARLQEFENVFSPTTHSAAHPRELSEQPQFLEAVALLKAPGVPLDTVLQYALGANWALACAALAALKQRPTAGRSSTRSCGTSTSSIPGRCTSRSSISCAQPRPPVGAPVLGAKDWWCDNAVIPMLFRDYFAARERLGDAPLFGRCRACGGGSRDDRSASSSGFAPLCDVADQSPPQRCSRRLSTGRSSPRSAASGRTARISRRWLSRRRGAMA